MVALLTSETKSRSHFSRRSRWIPPSSSRPHGRQPTHVTPKQHTPGSRTRKVGSRFFVSQVWDGGFWHAICGLDGPRGDEILLNPLPESWQSSRRETPKS